jgi:hypothetical protein
MNKKQKYSEETCLSATLSTTNPTWSDLVSNPDRRCVKSATNRLSYVTTKWNFYTEFWGLNSLAFLVAQKMQFGGGGIYLKHSPTANTSQYLFFFFFSFLLLLLLLLCPEIYYMELFHFFHLIKKQKYEVTLRFVICSLLLPSFPPLTFILHMLSRRACSRSVLPFLSFHQVGLRCRTGCMNSGVYH